jgi:hypothetical protein
MSNENEIVWTVLPNGVAGAGAVKLSVLVSPRLHALGGKLSGDFVDWPKALREKILPALRIRWESPNVAVAPQIDTHSRAADSQLWKRLFPDSTPVQAASALAAPDDAIKVLRSFPAAMVHDQITTLYQDIGAAIVSDRVTRGEPQAAVTGSVDIPQRPWRLPASSRVLDIKVVQGTSKFTTNRGATYADLNKNIGIGNGNGGQPGPHLGADEQPRPMTAKRDDQKYKDEVTRFALGEAFRFYDRSPQAAHSEIEQAEPPPPAPPNLDFHSVCGFLADYPELLRLLGLAIDLVVSVPAGVAEKGKLRVEFAGLGSPFNKERLRPWTQFRYTPGRRFTADSPDTDPIRDGWLQLSGEQFSVADIDVDSSMLKAVNFVDLIGKISDSDRAEEHLGTGSAALQGAGITVFHENRDAHLATQISADMKRTQATGDVLPVLTATDLVRGYRIDVAGVEASGALGPWRSLCRRKGTYTIRREGQPPFPIEGIAEDEGCVRSSAVTHDAANSKERYVHEALFSWDGWSLVAPLPGRILNEAGQLEPANPPVSKDFPLDTKFVPVPGSLPVLRYGHAYRLRARVVDLAGNSLGPDADVPEQALSAPITYSRWEPVPPPVVVPRKPFNEGESVHRLVIRSTVTDDGIAWTPSTWAALRWNVPDHTVDTRATDGLSRRYLDHDERDIAPPKSSVQMAERHGMFDYAIGDNRSPRDRERFYKAASRESGTFLDTVVSRASNPDFTRDLLFFREIHVAKHDTYDPTPLTPLPISRGAGLQAGEFVIHTAVELLLPYLPDFLARGVTFYGLPSAPPIYQAQSFYDIIHDSWPDAAPFRLIIEEGDRAPLPFAGQLTVYLPKAEMVTVRLSCRLSASDLPLFPVWRMMTASERWRRLTDEARALLTAETVAGLNWMLTPFVELQLVHAVEKPLARPEVSELKFRREPEQTFATVTDGTLRVHAKSTGEIEIDASWQEWVDDLTEPAPHQIQGHARVTTLHLDPSYPLPGKLPQLPIRHTFGDTKHRNVAYRPTALTRFREYFHPSITAQRDLVTSVGAPSTGGSERGWPIPSSRRPEPPAPAYLLPTFRWSRTGDRRAGRATSIRDGAGVRVYLNRPWFSSGDDELLAVILDPAATSPLPDQLTTRWGIDPVWSDTTALPSPALTHFPHPSATATGLRLAESSTTSPLTASAAAYQPIYDPDKQLWYCDVDLDLGVPARERAYFPYLRLALARYQPYSVVGLELSKIVQAEFAQPVPPRTLVVQQSADHGLLITLSGPTAADSLGALAGTGLPAVAASHRVTVSIQQRGSIADSELDWQPLGSPRELICQTAGSGFSWTAQIPPAEIDITLRYRLLIEEYERHISDPGTAEETVEIGGQQVPVGHRLTYAVTVPLTREFNSSFHLAVDFDQWLQAEHRSS